MLPALIAVVDDELLLLDLYTTVLLDEGYRVVACRNASEALASIKHDLPNVVILDPWFETPRGGWTIYEALIEDPTTASIPVILCTAADLSELHPPAELYAAPVAILYKPFLLDELVIAVKLALAS
jgi:CheY-like chemotaxis protein